MHACHDQAGWFVTPIGSLKGLTAQQASWKDGSTNNSIWQIVNHLIFWNGSYLNRFKGIQNPKFEGDNDSTFDGEKTSGTDDQWQETVSRLNSVLSEWESALDTAPDEKLHEPVRENQSDTWASYIAIINAHTAYHTGQIVTLRKQQGSWKPELGVN